MARILMAWELGKGRGHLAPLLSLATRLRDTGHHMELAVRDPKDAARFLKQAGLPFHATPLPGAVNTGSVLASYPQILRRLGFNDWAVLSARVRKWHTLFKTVSPDLLVCDHSPTALLAARTAHLKTLVTGTGFFVPPDISPLPDLRPWQTTDPDVLLRDESHVLEVINTVLQEFSAPQLMRISELFNTEARTLFTLAELDNYASYRKPEYWGPVPPPVGVQPAWPAGKGKRIFCYLRRFDTLPALLTELRNSAQPTLIYMPQQPRDLMTEFEGGNLHFSHEPLDMDAVAQQCDLGILHAGHGVTAALLLAGKPMLHLPLHLEMLLTAQLVAGLGAALVAPELRPAGMGQKLTRLLEESGFGEAASKFAERHAGLDVKAIPSRFAALVERIIAL